MPLLFPYTYGKIARVHAKTIEELVFYDGCRGVWLTKRIWEMTMSNIWKVWYGIMAHWEMHECEMWCMIDL